MAKHVATDEVIAPENPWKWEASTVSEGGITYAGYTMHSSANPKVPGDLCRWAVYKTTAHHVVIALNGCVFGHDRTGFLIKAQGRIERTASAFGHKPVELPAKSQPKKGKTK